MVVTKSGGSQDLDQVLGIIRSRLEEAEIAGAIAQRLACRQFPKNLQELRYGPVRSERQQIVKEHRRKIDQEIEKIEDGILQVFQNPKLDTREDESVWKDIAQEELIREKDLQAKEKKLQRSLKAVQLLNDLWLEQKGEYQEKVKLLEGRVKTSEDLARFWQARAKDLEANVRRLEDRVREAEASEKQARKAEQEARCREKEAREEARRSEKARPPDENTNDGNSERKTRSSDQPPYRTWLQSVNIATKKGNITRCPALPHVHTCNICVQATKTRIFGSLPMCFHEFGILLLGSGPCDLGMYKRERLIWHPDRFGKFCHPSWREEGKKEAQKLFQLFGQLIDEWNKTHK